jgi:hypothetical protein
VADSESISGKFNSMATLDEWKEFAGRVREAAIQMATSINLPLTDEIHIYGAALLARTISNFQSVLTLLEVRQIIEAQLTMRVIAHPADFWDGGVLG